MYHSYYFIYVDNDGNVKNTTYIGNLKWCIKSFERNYPGVELIKIQRYDYYGYIHNANAKKLKQKIR